MIYTIKPTRQRIRTHGLDVLRIEPGYAPCVEQALGKCGPARFVASRVVCGEEAVQCLGEIDRLANSIACHIIEPASSLLTGFVRRRFIA